MLTVLTSSTESMLTTVTRAKSVLGVTASSTGEDEEVENLIRGVTDEVASFIGYWPFRQVYSETIRSYGNLRLMTARTPIRGLSGVFLGNALVLPSSYEIEDAEAGFIHREQGWPWSAGTQWDLSAHIVAHSELPRFQLIYEAGWVRTNNELSGLGWLSNRGGRTLPWQIEEAALELIQDRYDARSVGRTVKSRTIGDFSITYADRPDSHQTGEMPTRVLGALNTFRRIK